MQKTNLQVRVSSRVDKEIVRLAPNSRSDFIRQAIEEKIRKETFKRLELEWIKALTKSGEDSKETEFWPEAWGSP